MLVADRLHVLNSAQTSVDLSVSIVNLYSIGTTEELYVFMSQSTSVVLFIAYISWNMFKNINIYLFIFYHNNCILT